MRRLLSPSTLRAGVCLAWLALLPSAARAGISLDFEGRDQIGAYVLRDLVPEEPEKPDDEEATYWGEAAAAAVEDYYREQGYFQATVDAKTVRPDRRKLDWKVTLTIREGPQYRFGRVRIVADGDTAVGVPVGELQARADRPYLRERVIRDVRDITRTLGNSGFMRAEVEQELLLRDSAARVDVIYRVARGVPVVFSALRLSVRRAGADDSLPGLTRDSLLISLVPYRPGDTVRVDANDKIIEKLQSTGLYNTVRIEDSLRADGISGSVLTLDVEERVPGRLNASVFYETQYGFGVSGDVKHSNVAGGLHEVRLGAGLAQNKQNVGLGYGSPLTLGMLLRFDDDFTVEWFQDKLPDEPIFAGDLRVANVASLSRSFARWLRGVAGTELEYKSRLVTDSAGDLDRESGGLLNVTATAFASFLDQPLDPARGMRFALTAGNGGPVWERGALRVIQERHNWLEARSAFYAYYPAIPQFKLALRLDGGRFFGAGGQNADRFFLGGPRSVRSYGFHQVCADVPAPDEGSCPLDETALEPAYFLTSAELRLSPFDVSFVSSRGVAGLFKPLTLVPFVDYGKVWNLRGDEAFAFSSDFFGSGVGRAMAYGGGIRYPLLGIFNFRLDLAWGRPSGNNWPDQWVIDLAQAF